MPISLFPGEGADQYDVVGFWLSRNRGSMHGSKVKTLQKRNMTGCANDLQALISYLPLDHPWVKRLSQKQQAPPSTTDFQGRQYLQTARMQGPCDGHASLSHGCKRDRPQPTVAQLRYTRIQISRSLEPLVSATDSLLTRPTASVKTHMPSCP